MRKVLVLDANQRSALAIIRSLGRHNVEIVAGDHIANSLGGASRYAAASVRYSNPAVLPYQFAREISDIVGHKGIDTIFPATDLTTMLLVSQSNLPKNVHLAAARPESYEALTDKGRLIELAGRLGVPIPETRMARTRGAILEAARGLGFPVVIKPARSRYLKRDQVISTGVEIARSPDELSRVVQSLTWLEDIPCLVQRFVAGHGAGIFALYGTSGPIAWFAHRRIREKPPSGGVSVLCESAPVDPTMQSAAAKLLSAVNWTGVAMVEFRVAEDGTAYLMEVNGRFWGSLQLSIDSGIDFPWLLYQTIHGVPFTLPRPYAVGKRLRWLLGDLDSLLIALRRNPSNIGQKMRIMNAFVRSFLDLRCRQEILRLSDPRPGLRETRQWIRALVARES